MTTAQQFDRLFEANDDPWSFRTSFYERRKRALTLACLPRPRFRAAFEPGCANAELSAELAGRCDRLLCADGSSAAIALARQRLRPLGSGVEVRRLWVPDEWPDERFDLIVLSELLYYLEPDQIDRLIERVEQSLEDTGTCVACHWRYPVHGARQSTDEIHHQLASRLSTTHISRIMEEDFVIDVWSRDGRSVAVREGLRPATP